MRHTSRVGLGRCWVHPNLGLRMAQQDRMPKDHIAPMRATCRPGITPGWTAATAASAIRATPNRRSSNSPRADNFSSTMTPASAAIAATFITPTATSTIMRPQQHPTQYAPWWAPGPGDECRGWLVLHIQEGHKDDVDLSGVNVALAYTIPDKPSAGNRGIGIIADTDSSDEQASALEAIFTGKDGGPWGTSRGCSVRTGVSSGPG